MKNKKSILMIVISVLMMILFVACDKNDEKTTTANNQSKKINVVTTIFPIYDFVRQIAGDQVNLTMLLPPGAESHSYEPTPQDIIKIHNSNLFLYVGGDSDAWVNSILKSTNKDKMNIMTLMDCVTTVEEESVEGMQAEEDEEKGADPELDEHVWTSPKNAILIVKKITNQLCKIDSSHSKVYKSNSDAFIQKLTKLDQEIKYVVDHSHRKEIIVGDRFPFRYFVDAYGLKYYAAFPGCSTDTEPSAATVSFLIDKVKEDKIPVIFHIELSNEQMCDSISKATGAKKELLNAVHNVTKDDFKAGVTYLDLMERNVKILKEALN